MIEISYVEHEQDENGQRVVHHDPRRGLSDYTVYLIHTRKMMTDYERRRAGEYVKSLLNAADYSSETFAKVAREPITCYAKNVVCIELVLFSSFTGGDIMRALASGRKNLGR